MPENSIKQEQELSFKELLRDVAICIILTVMLIQIIGATIVHQTSMYPTCHDGDYILIAKKPYLIKEPACGDIIIFDSHLLEEGETKTKLYIKRIIAVPGAHLEIRDNKVYINDQILDESAYLSESVKTEGDEDIVVPDGYYFVMGDNREDSIDSRDPAIGLVSKDDIYGKTLIRLLPISRIGRVK